MCKILWRKLQKVLNKHNRKQNIWRVVPFPKWEC